MAKSRPISPVTPLPAVTRACPICGKPAASARHQPFCSPRCADIDLGRWLKGNYAVPTDEAPDDASREEDG
jgi:endogenous inhibitor of DNA gyrase (YacG/DUF329 family)